MATEEDTPTMAAAEGEDPKPASDNLPSYQEMILGAIEALDDKNGSNKTAISQYIEEKYEGLPAAHPSLLTAHLARMKQTGELVFSKNNYFRGGDPAIPPKRGRGRPPKAKDATAAAAAATRDPVSSPRPRGRPPKPKDPVAEAVAKATSGMPRARGRPPKKAKVDQGAPIGAPAASAAAPEAGAAPVKRGRGRPPKVRPAAAPVGEPAAA
ncbi:HMG-Y-related protein A-like [Oryza brachyantha]|uniref:HMG-Y-related protein A-like n=1 Tax=Oryza brachyantha TaxID=4533 RepID=UPI001ADB3B3E|nr:HMG-Y-related protein A-like [Oryza brachyantha]